MKVFLAGTSFELAYGGPAHSVSRLAGALACAGIDVGLWAPDQSALTTPLVEPDSAVQRLGGTAASAFDQFGPADIVHDNGLWRAHNHRLAEICSARGLPRVVSIRGMLEPWAVNHKRVKKRLAWWLYQRRDLERAHCHHATAEAEASNVRSLGLHVPVLTIPNGIDVPKPCDGAPPRRSADVRTALFVGRIYPVKGLPVLIEAWASVRPQGWMLKIAGPDESGHRKNVEALVAATGLDNNVTFLGPLTSTEKERELSAAELFVLPSHSESFGMAVGEALAHGLPVLTTTATPWPELSNRGCGWRVDASVQGIAAGLRRATALDRESLSSMGARGRDLVRAQFQWGSVARRFVEVYENLIAGKQAA